MISRTDQVLRPRTRRRARITPGQDDSAFAALDRLPAMVWRSGRDARCDYFNKAWLEFTGRRLDQELGDGWTEGVHPDDRERCVRDYLKAFEARQPFALEYRLRHRDEHYRWIHDLGRPFFDPAGVFAGYIGVCFDLTERKHGEALLTLQSSAAIAISEASDFRSALEVVLRLTCELTGWQIGDAWLPAPDGTHLVWSGAYYSSISGLERFFAASEKLTTERGKRFLGRVWDNAHPMWREEANVGRRDHLVPGGIRVRCGIPAIADGQVVAVLSFFSQTPQAQDQRMLDAIGGIAAQLGMLLARKRTEEALRKSEERFALFASHAQGAFFIKDAAGRYVYANPVTEWDQRVEPGGSLGKTDDELFTPAIARQIRANDRKVLEEGTPIQTVEVIGEENPRYWLVNKFLIPGGPDSGPLLAGACFEVTELKRAEAALRESEQRLRDALHERERLSQDLHDHIVQAIYAIGLELEECRHLILTNPNVGAVRVERATANLNDVIRDVRRYISGAGHTGLTGVQFRAELSRLAKRLGAGTLRYRIRVERVATDRLTPAEADHVLNIAREAMSNALRHSRGQRGLLSLRVVNGEILLEVSDDGAGFDPGQRRENGGLSIMERRARQIGATIEFHRAKRGGSRIVLRIPKPKHEHDRG